MSNDDFWDSFLRTAYAGGHGGVDFASEHLVEDAVETRMAGRSLEEGALTSVRALAQREEGLTLPVAAGTRVQFSPRAEATLAYEDPPVPNAVGVVVSVRSASGEITSHDGVVFVQWADKVLRPIYADHLRLAKGTPRVTAAASGRIRVASLGDLTDFLRVASDTLVHKATRDLWRVNKDGGDFVIERLFKDDGSPLKV